MQSIVLPKNVLDQINCLFYRFLWKRRFNNKRAYEKVKRKVMSNEYDDGGLRMIDIYRSQNSILINWVNALLSPSVESWKYLAKQYFKNLGGLNCFRSNVNSKMFKGLCKISSTFWSKAFACWLDFYSADKNRAIHLNDPIFNNCCVLYKGETLFLPSCIDRGILKLEDVLYDKRILTLHEFTLKFGNYPRCVLDHNLISNALKSTIDKHDNVVFTYTSFVFQGLQNP